MTSIDEEWSNYLCGDISPNNETITETLTKKVMPDCAPLYISTTTKVLFLNHDISHLHDIFWNIPIMPYHQQANGVIKKQMKIVSKTPEEYEEYTKKLDNVPYYCENIIKQINNPDARRIKFKDERKITIGVSKKDIMSSRGKVKNAFYNCFALILRFWCAKDLHYREIHVKVFNTGKLEIPGILNIHILESVKELLLIILSPYFETELVFVTQTEDNNVLINSNFNCGFYIERNVLFQILKNTYNLDCAFEPCSYPGIKCKFYFKNKVLVDNEQKGIIENGDKKMKLSELIASKKYTEISFMIFRTGSCLIIGNCSEVILNFVYEFVKKILQDNYQKIMIESEVPSVKHKMPKIKKKYIIVNP